ncbi:hypothetical protein GJ496_011154 [Pomphorhynchus laevis]|nr:hypothetical protein GJ496_011154 [Pomphorhynchus laevis]
MDGKHDQEVARLKGTTIDERGSNLKILERNVNLRLKGREYSSMNEEVRSLRENNCRVLGQCARRKYEVENKLGNLYDKDAMLNIKSSNTNKIDDVDLSE